MFGDAERDHKWSEINHLSKITGKPSLQILPNFATRTSVVFAYVVAPGGKSGYY
jgi:hypothetical protein